MKQAKIADLKNNLSRYLARVRAGETITVLDRNQPIARLVPISRADRRVALGAHLAELERKGWLRRGTGGLPRWFGKRRIRVRGSVPKDLLEERESGW
jgi:prevent-host-death family protein